MSGRLSQYNTLGRLGAGAMGELYRARDTRYGRTVALRILSPTIAGDPEQRLRFLRDAERAAALSHPNIATLYEVGEDGDQLFAAFEFVPGDSLKSIIAAGPIHPRRAVQAAAQVADALAEGHARGMVHGALDADHVVITPKGNAKVLDFGLSSWSGASVRTGELNRFDDDLAALGILLQDMARGISASGQGRAVPQIDRIVARALCEDPAERYDSAATLAADLRTVEAALEAEHARTPDRRQAVPPHLTSRTSTARLSRLVLALTIAAAAGTAWVARGRLTHTWQHAAGSPSRAVLAVGPFQRSDGSRDYIADGIRQDLAARLGQTAGIQVIGRTLAPTVRPVANMSRPAGAGAVLEGTVGLGGGYVTIAVRLVDASGDEIWTKDYRRELKDVFPLQSQIADDVTREVGVPVRPTAATERDAVRIVDPSAYDAYLRGKNAASEGRLADAEAFLARAVEMDDGLAEAHASLVLTLLGLAQRGGPDADWRWQRAKRSANRALELTPDLPAANLAAAAVADSLALALNALKAAISFDPSYADGYREIAEQIGDFDDSRAEKFRAKALALDPAEQAAGHATEPPAESCVGTVRAAISGTERRQTAPVRTRLNAFVDSGDTESAGPYTIRCAALAAAALGKGTAASALISRIAAKEDFLRIWAVRPEGLAGSNALRRRSLPWSRVEDQPAFTGARTALEQAYDRARRQIAASLDGVAF
jgi:serine/threonine-protein kinase